MRKHSQADIKQALAEDLGDIRNLWREYWNSLSLGPEFQSFAEELRTLPGRYAPPRGRLLSARVDNEVAGTAALRPIDHVSCEAKRLYVRPHYRGKGVGRALLFELIKEARSAGYKEIYGDTLLSMTSALRLYRQIGFSETGPYSSNPTPGAIFVKLSL